MKIRIHREGKMSLILSGIATVIVSYASYYFLRNTSFWWLMIIIIAGMLAFFGLMVNFFRNPLRTIEIDEDVIYAPCDGKVVVIEEITDNTYFNRKMIQVSIFMSPLNVHVNRNPISGTVQFSKYFKGKYLAAWNPKSSEENERTYIVTKNKDGLEVGYKQIAGGLARRIVNYLKVGDEVWQGREFGFIKLGSRMDLILPTNCKIVARLGDKTEGGKTVIARLR
jgi:phosphatidylserine decarboxylase